MDVPTLEIALYGQSIGSIRRTEDGSVFEFSLEYLDRNDRPVLGQRFEDDLVRSWSVRSGLPAWCANLLPEGRLRTLLAERADVHPSREYFLLAQLGADLPG